MSSAAWDWGANQGGLVIRVVLHIAYRGPTDRSGSRYSVHGGSWSGKARRCLVPYDHSLGLSDRIAAAAQAWVDRWGRDALRAECIDRGVAAVRLLPTLGRADCHEVVVEISARDA